MVISTLSSSAGNLWQTFGTLAVDTGKYYWETKLQHDVTGQDSSISYWNNTKVHGGT